MIVHVMTQTSEYMYMDTCLCMWWRQGEGAGCFEGWETVFVEEFVRLCRMCVGLKRTGDVSVCVCGCECV